MKKIFTLFAAIVLSAIGLYASGQIITSEPVLLQEASKNVKLIYHADSPLGNGGLAGLPSTTEVYVHIGVITNNSKSVSDWKYATPNWGDNVPKYKLNYVSANTYSLEIGDIRTYFGITDNSETVQKIACVFRTSDCKKEGKTASGGDIFVDVLEPGFQMRLIHNGTSDVIKKTDTDKSRTFTFDVTDAANLSLEVNGTPICESVVDAKQLVGSYTFPSTGTYTVTAKAVYGGTTYTTTNTIVYLKESSAKNYPGGVPKMGVNVNNGMTTFCLAAPGKENVVLVTENDDYAIKENNTMYYQDYGGMRYFWINKSGFEDGNYHGYYFLVDGTIKVGDPYAKIALDPYSDKWLNKDIWPDSPQYPYGKFSDTMISVYKNDLDEYNFSDFTIPDHKQLIIYELLVRDFTGTNGESKGEGTLKSAIEKLPYLKKLGVNAVELMPVMEFNGNNSWGYNTNFYMALDKSYGSPTDLKDFVEACHINGMAVILDIALNHSDGLHPWYQMYEVGNNPFYNATAPHKWSVLNDWNQDHALVKQYFKDVLQYWMTAYNVDGYRFDLEKGLGPNSCYTAGGENTDSYIPARVANMKVIHSYLTAVKPNAIHINEGLVEDAQEDNNCAADGQLNWRNTSYPAQQYAMGFAEGIDQIKRFLSTNEGRTWGTTVAYAESHDEERSGFKALTYGDATVAGAANVANRTSRLGALATQLLLTPGPKMIWQFGELGADETTKNDGENNTDPKKVIWDRLEDSNYAALCKTYEMICNLRLNNPELFSQSAVFTPTNLDKGSLTQMRAIRLTNGDKEVMAFINPNTGTRTVGAVSTKLNANNCQLVCASPGFNGKLNGTGTAVSVSLAGHGYAVFATSAVTVAEGKEFNAGIEDVISDATETVSERYYNLQGIPVSADCTGIVVKVSKMADGTTKAVKVYNR